MRKTDERDRRAGLIGTILFHGLIVAGLFFLSLNTPLPLPGEEGVEVDLGYSDQGMGDIQPLTPPPTSSPQESQPNEAVEEVSTQDIEESVALPEKPKEKPRQQPKPNTEPVKEAPKQKEPEKPKVDPRALYTGSQSGTSGQGSQGVTGQAGDQGKPTGSPGSGQYDGQGGSGNGVSYSLGGRKADHLPKPSATFSESGTVVVNIWVDRYGKVTKAVAGARGTTTASPVLRRLAEEAALRARFNAQMDAPEEQRGTITYHFLIKS
ncbi:MAG TPA: TonB family protein [Bacteroidales bacterium]|nr:TonB family protein [Bacteroidales bacterium]HRZ75826.1 TonB family protein [Bacteroidales bacterium]